MRLTSASVHFRTLAILTLSCLMPLGIAVKADPATDADFAALHTEIGRTMDRRYYEAGRRVDLALFDFEEMARQGRPAPRDLRRRAERADREMRARWLALEKRRAALDDRRRALPPRAPHNVRIENLETAAGDAGWFGVRASRIEWQPGVAVELKPQAFTGGAVIEGYAYRVEKSTGAFVYGKGSGQDVMTAGFGIPAAAGGVALLTLDALDDDKPGATRVRITVDGTPVFEGENPFSPDGWSTHTFGITEFTSKDESAGSDAEAAVREGFAALERDIEAFGAWADGQAADVERVSAKARAGLVWKRLDVADDWWSREFLRGVCYVPFAQEMEHHFKSFRGLGANLLYSYTGLYNKPSELPATLAMADRLGLPYVQFTHTMRNEERDRLYLGDADAMMASARAFLKEVEGDSGVPVHLAVDEPNFRDEYAKDPAVLAAFRAYLAEHPDALLMSGADKPENAVPTIRIADVLDEPRWMVWQMFKTWQMGRNYARLWGGLQRDGRFPFVIVQDHRSDFPQQASHVTMGAALPLISTDLYSNGTVREALVMDLVRHAAKGRAILTAGAGYSDHTPDRFRRSMAVAMAHADGVLQWTDIYFQKYRDPIAFWKSATDDQGRAMLANWRPEYWDIMREEYHRMEQAGSALGGGTSQARVAVLFSERTAIAESAESGEPYMAAVQGLYSDLLRRGKPLDARYVETLTPENLADLRVLLLPNARTLTKGEMGLLRAWVRRGGTLIATGQTSLNDEWGQFRHVYGLGDVFGVRLHGSAAGARSYRVEGREVLYGQYAPYASVTLLEGARVAGSFDTGDPAVVTNAYGRGRAWLFTGHEHFARAGGRRADSGLFGSGHAEETALVARIVDEAAGEDVVTLENAPDGLEMQVREKGGATIVHATDWNDNRTVKGLRLLIDRPGRWKAFYPAGKREERMFTGPATITLRPFRIHEMVVIEEVR